MDYSSIIVEIGDDYVAEITLNRPKSLNTFTVPLATELSQAFQELDSDKNVRVVIVKGAGKVFCAGIDVSDFSEKSTMEYRDWVECMEDSLVVISRMNKPVIAQVHGVAAANGAGLVAAADLAVAAESARLGLTAINVGLNCIGPVVPVSRSIGRKRALEMLFYGDLISAQEALNMGLVNRVIPDADLDQETRSWAALLAQKSPVALQIAKKAFYAAADQDYYKAFEYMNEAFARLCSTEDAKEGISAFMEKRTPVWKEK
ncbi:MAG: enoyl-CoA hydratase/isomerase family protein [Deltaproteobacteria bacterium]|jgi:enoyl-CoA hydratase/carnithine racemase|nr:enoyl-CoA hydratase/isomerase family protein [Deltaproteobacteria bacterium]